MRVAIFSSHKYDQGSFEEANDSFRHELVFFTGTLDSASAPLASGFPAVCAFVNDRLDAPVLAQLAKGGTKFVALRCAGYNNVDLGACGTTIRKGHGRATAQCAPMSRHWHRRSPARIIELPVADNKGHLLMAIGPTTTRSRQVWARRL